MQSKSSLSIFRFLAGFVSIYHLVLGLIGTFASVETLAPIITKVYGVTPVIDGQFIILTHFISAYMIVFGITAGILALEPVKYQKLVWVPITLFVIRIIERLVFFDSLNETFTTTTARNFQVIIPIAIIAIGLFYFRPKSS